MEKLQSASKKITENEVMQLLSNFDEVIEKGTLDERRSVIEKLIEKIVIDGDDITIHWNFI